MDRDQLIAAITATGHTESIHALEALGADPSVEALTPLLEAAKKSKMPAPPDPAMQTAKAGRKKPGRLPVRVGANVTTSKGKGKVTKVDGSEATVTLADGSTETIAVSALKAHMAVKSKPKKHQMPAQESDVLSHEDTWDDVMNDVRAAVSAKFSYGSPAYPGQYCYIVDFFDDYVVISCGDELYRVSWTQDDKDVVTLGDMEPVELQYVTDSMSTESCLLAPLDDDGHLIEAEATPSGKKWLAVFIQEGMSKNRNFYPAEVIREAVDLYDNRPVYRGHDPNPGRFGRNPDDAIGFTKQPRVQTLEAATTESVNGRVAIVGQLVLTDPTWRAKLVEAWEEGNPNFVGLSHDVLVKGRLMVGDASGPYKRAEKIEECKSVDLVMSPAAGGRLMQMVAANGLTATDVQEMQMLQKMIEAIKASKRADLIAALEALGQNATEDAVMGLHAKLGAAVPVQEAVVVPPVVTGTVDPNAPKPLSLQEGEELRQFAASARKQNSLLLIDANLRECALPAPVKANVKKRLTKMVESGMAVVEDTIVAEIRDEVEAYGKVFEGRVIVPGHGAPRFEITKSNREQFSEALDAFFGVKTITEGTKTRYERIQERTMSFRNLYAEFTGDHLVTGRVEESTRLTESLDSTSFTKVLGDSITRRMVAEYQLPEFQVWRGTVGDVVPLNDFRTQRRLRFGGYGNLAIVAQGAPYLAMTSPTDEEATYSPAKRGGTEAVTLEMIKNDDVGVIKKIPVRLGRAAGQTLYEFVFDFMRTNAAIYDSTALAAAGHGSNISTTALSLTQVSNARLVMREQTDMSSGKRLGLKLRYLWVPVDLEDLAWQITGADKMVPDSNLAGSAEPAAPNPGKRYGVQPMTVDYWTDTNNYWGTASLDQTPMIEIGFLDGREDPELFVQDQPNVGSLFSNDQITWKVRHIYGGGVLDFRGFFGGIVP